MPSSTAHIDSGAFLDQIDQRLPREDMQGLRKIVTNIQAYWNAQFPEAKNTIKRLKLFESQATDIIHDADSGAYDYDTTTRAKRDFTKRLINLIDDLREYVEDEESREETERQIAEQLAISMRKEEALRALEELDFDEKMAKRFNLLYRLYSAPFLFVIHGGDAKHGQRWLYNRLVRFNKFFNHPPVLYILLNLEAKSSQAGLQGFIDTLRKKLAVDQNSKEAIFNALLKHLDKRDIVITFKSRFEESVKTILKFCNWLQKEVAQQQPRNKLVFFLCLEELFTSTFRFENPKGMQVEDQLPLICDTRFCAWIDACSGIAYRPILDNFGEILLEEEAEQLLRCKTKLKKIKFPNQDIMAEFGEGFNDDDHSIPAETFISEITQKVLQLDWIECKKIWLKY
ncbi:MAG: hypothetical protein AAGG75_14540 [Bacteroidota bacterium]